MKNDQVTSYNVDRQQWRAILAKCEKFVGLTVMPRSLHDVKYETEMLLINMLQSNDGGLPTISAKHFAIEMSNSHTVAAARLTVKCAKCLNIN